MGHFLKLHTRAYYPRGHMWVKFQRNRPRSQHPTTTHPTPPTRTGPQNFTKYFRPHRFPFYAIPLHSTESLHRIQRMGLWNYVAANAHDTDKLEQKIVRGNSIRI